jgi:lipopolysaccharide/colanic/teichoic acid biosynthesis glycosyltransferase
MVKNQNNASNEMIQNYKQIYNLDYLKNWGLFLSILIAALTIKKIFIQK